MQPNFYRTTNERLASSTDDEILTFFKRREWLRPDDYEKLLAGEKLPETRRALLSAYSLGWKDAKE